MKDILVFAWQHMLFHSGGLRTSAGDRVQVVRPGIRDAEGFPEFRDAEITIGDRTLVGSVSVHESSSDWALDKRNRSSSYDGVILNVVNNDDLIIRRIDDTVVPSVELSYPEKLFRALKMLRDGAEGPGCPRFVRRNMEEIELKNGCTRLLVERLERKYNDIMAVHEYSENCWPETFHIMMFRSMGLGSNKEVYMSLAKHIPYSVLCKEKGDIKAIEAMILGVGGLLDNRVYDEYKTELCHIFDVMSEKHGLKVLEYCEWTDRGVRPYNFAPKRLAQIAKLIDSGNFTFENVISCRSVKEAKKLFDIELSAYWKRSFDFGKRSPATRKGVGDMTIDIMMINLVAPIMFAYGRETGDEELQERAVDVLYEVGAEINRYTKGWIREGVKIDNAFYSQAFIQLSTEYCLPRRCIDCFIGVRALKSI